VSVDTDNEEEVQLAMEGILKAVPAEYSVALDNKDLTKEAWDARRSMQLGGERACKAKSQQTQHEYEALEFKDGEAIEDFTLRLITIVTELGALDAPVGEQDAVQKLLHCVPEKYD
jgi:hypothetical protein